jgi:hypothetical protein
MLAINFRRAPCPVMIVLAVLALFLGGCRTSQPAEVRTDPALPTNSEPNSNSKVVIEKTSLTGRIDNVSMYPVPNSPEDLALSLVVSITNTGAPTTTQGWNLELNSPSRPAPTVLKPVHVNGSVEMPGTNGKKVDLAKEDLALKTAQVPIANGAQVKAILTFVLIKTSEKALSNNKTSLTIHFKDSQGNPYQTPKSVIGSKAARP